MADAVPVAESVVSSPLPGAASNPLRLWPGVMIVVVQLAVIFIPGWLAPGTLVAFLCMFWAPMAGAALLMAWWLFFSRAPWLDRVLIPVVAIALGLAATKIADKSMPFGLLMYGIPTICAVWVGWLALSGSIGMKARRVGLMLLFVATWGYFCTIRLDGIAGNMASEISWRWEPTAEERFLAGKSTKSPANRPETLATVEELTLTNGDWPAFRGEHRDGITNEAASFSDWSTTPPKLLWKQPLGPGWGSVTVIGQRLFTQEQRGDSEAVVCYSTKEGHELWAHTDSTRFWEVVAGAGPRATPTFHNGRLYTLGANGLLNCLHATTGEKIWSTETAKIADAKVPMWGFAGSPLVINDLVIVLLGNPSDSAMLAFDAATGEKRWTAGPGSHSYSSPQLAHLGGIEQILSVTDAGITGLDPVNGHVLWNYDWPIPEGYRALQPLVIDDSVVVSTPAGTGCRRIRVTRNGEEWTTELMWDSLDIKPNFNDFVPYDGHLYGFDGNMITCVDLNTGKRKWKRGRYGFGQVLLIKNQGLLLVQAESGEVVLVEASAKQLVEKGKFPALNGKTWNHPVIAHGQLFVRNGEEIAVFELPPAETSTAAVP